MAEKNVRLVRQGQIITNDDYPDGMVVRSVDIVVNLANGVSATYGPQDLVEVSDPPPEDPEVESEIEFEDP